MAMNGPSAQALREGGVGGSLRYKNGTTLCVRIASGAPPPQEWKKKTTLQSTFGDFGQILRIDVPEGQGMAYIEYEDRDDAAEAEREMQGKRICGQAVTVQLMTASNSGRCSGGGDVQTRVAAMARHHNLDEAAAARLVSVFTERVRLGCDLNRDIAELSDHLGASNKPSALVSMKLAELRTGQPIGPCRFTRSARSRLPASSAEVQAYGSGRALEDWGSYSGSRGRSGSRGEQRHGRPHECREPRERRRSRERERDNGRSRSRRRERLPRERREAGDQSGADRRRPPF